MHSNSSLSKVIVIFKKSFASDLDNGWRLNGFNKLPIHGRIFWSVNNTLKVNLKVLQIDQIIVR